MNTAIATTLISVLGAGLLSFLILQLRTITGSLNRITDHLKDHGERLARIEETAKGHGERLARIEETAKGHGERLARIEIKLDDNPPPRLLSG